MESHYFSGGRFKATFSYYNSEKLQKKYGIKFVGEKTKKFKVSGLSTASEATNGHVRSNEAESAQSIRQLVKVDPFDKSVFNVDKNTKGVILKFEGTSPSAELEIINNTDPSDPRAQITYTADKEMFIAKGDEITISAKPTNPGSFEENGYELSQDTTTIKCEKVNEYVKDISEIPESTVNILKQDAKDRLQSLAAQAAVPSTKVHSVDSYIEYQGYDYMPSGLSDFKLTTARILNAKQGAVNPYVENGGNKMLIEFTAEAAPVGHSGMTSTDYPGGTVYGTLKIDNLVKSVDGTVAYTSGQMQISQKMYTSQNDYMGNNINTQTGDYAIQESDISSWN